jgi:hypothetical protein
MAIITFRRAVLILIVGLVQSSSSKTLHSRHHHKCPENSYIAGLSLRHSAEAKISSIRFYCTRSNVLSEFRKDAFIEQELGPQDAGTEIKWTEPWFCDRGIATGLQVQQNAEDTQEHLRLACSDSSTSEAGIQDNWFDLNKCSAGQALCALAFVDGKGN